MSTKRNKYSIHSFFMNLALMQANKVLGNTKKNPAVGCIITKNGSSISAGFTSINGRPHAERNAINFSKKNLNNSQLYVTLEPCSHYGKTPPCVNLIIKNKIKKVFFSIKDPDPRSFNKSSSHFKRNGINVKSNISLSDTSHFYRSYIKSKSSSLPFVTSKLAISKDFFTINKKDKWITNKYSRGRVHLMRSNHDCVLTSSNTIIKDNPRLNCRIHGLENRSPSRIILDNKLQIPIKSKIFNEACIIPTIIFYNRFNKKKIRLLKSLKIKTIKTTLDDNGNLNLREMLIKAKKLGFYRIFLETGLKLTTNFLSENLVDDFKLFISNRNLGTNGRGCIKKYLKFYLRDKRCINEKVNLFGDKLKFYVMK